MARAVLALWLVACPIGGCRFDPPGGESADAGNVAPVADAGPTEAGRCGGPGTILDDFADGAIGPQWRQLNGGVTLEAGGQLVVTPMYGLAGVAGDVGVDLRDASIEVEIAAMVDLATSASASFVAQNRGLVLGFTQRNGVLTAVIDRANGRLQNDVPYDQVQHRWWRIADAAGTITLATSPDGRSWAPVLTGTNVAFTAAVAVRMTADATGLGVAVGSVAFQNLRAAEGGIRVLRAAWCDAGKLVDDFPGSTLAFQWAASAEPAATCEPSVGGGKLHLDQPNYTSCSATVMSMARYDLAASAVAIDVDPIANLPYGFGGWVELDDGASRVSLYANNGYLCALVGDYDQQCTSYVGQRYWRFRGDAGGLVWETSPDLVDWIALRAQGAPLDLARVRVSLGSFNTYGQAPAVDFAASAVNP